MTVIAPLTRHRVSGNVIVCEGGARAECHVYPDCECDFWDFEEGADKHRHPDVPHAECWAIQWTNASSLDDTSEAELPESEIHDGPVELVWEGDYMLWRYLPESADSEVTP